MLKISKNKTNWYRRRINKYGKIINLAKNNVISYSGNSPSVKYIATSGLIRKYYVDELGNDVTKDFYMESVFLVIKNILLPNEVSFVIEYLENCVCIELLNELIKYMVTNYEDFNRQSLHLVHSHLYIHIYIVFFRSHLHLLYFHLLKH
ncbi:hypothetical protein [Mycoplasma sp. P36-A1]|uniref:hypothetical protein n=1 Tax=Mycoplasma sp. P36-A1 TaxID=3252900 RepID=UPI003C2C3A23